jgi:hypothetical protein
VYQVAAQEGAFAEDAGAQARSGGARLVHLGTGHAKVAETLQEPLGRSDDPLWAHRLVTRAAQGMAGAHFPASDGRHCRSCGLAHCCPTRPEGRQVGR